MDGGSTRGDGVCGGADGVADGVADSIAVGVSDVIAECIAECIAHCVADAVADRIAYAVTNGVAYAGLCPGHVCGRGFARTAVVRGQSVVGVTGVFRPSRADFLRTRWR